MDAIIHAEDLRFSYEEDAAPVLEGLSLDIERGSFTAILGHNGSGKSTLAKLFNGILLPTAGRVTVNGIDTADSARILDVRRTVGLVFQNPDNQIVASVVEDDVAFAPENLGVPSAEIRERVDEALRSVGMYEFRLHAPHLLSGGQKQRVAIAGVLAMRPECIVLDEPTAMLGRVRWRGPAHRHVKRKDRAGRRAARGVLPRGGYARRGARRSGDDGAALSAQPAWRAFAAHGADRGRMRRRHRRLSQEGLNFCLCRF